ncbi:MAG TPA: hypothetical protein VFH68_11870 [Polyangia bacterium]|nr:hypothetical protein [Polyangia bacterium]
MAVDGRQVRARWSGSLLLAVVGLSAPLAGAGGCEPAPIDNKSCDCVAPYFCCHADNVCLPPGAACVDVGPWPPVTARPAPLPMDRYTVFAASQVDLGGQDEQVFQLKPDLLLRGWSQWNKFGVEATDYVNIKVGSSYVSAFDYAERCRGNGITFLGGAATSVIFGGQFGGISSPLFEDFATVDIQGKRVEHSNLSPDMYRASLANPRYRAYVVDVAKLQIDGGVDGLNFDEINEGYQGYDFTGNEGFDDYNLADFNAFLLAKYPGEDLRRKFDLPADNYPRADVPAGDLARNFNYRRYLNGTTQGLIPPFAGEKIVSLRMRTSYNHLAEEWRGSMPDRPSPGSTSFVDQAVPYRYWRDIVEKVRAYTARPLLISAKGIYPLVDFQSVALNNYAPECPLAEPTCFLPLGGDRTPGSPLDGTRSLQPLFRLLRQTSEQFSGGFSVPVVLYLDGLWSEYDALGDQERADYWRIYAAEAYANGLFYAFRLTTAHAPSDNPRTATEGHVLDTMIQLASFYRENAGLYHGVRPADAAVTTSLPTSSLMIAVADRPGGGPSDGQSGLAADVAQRLVHLVNHDYRMASAGSAGGLVRQENVTVSIPVARAVSSVQLVSPDLVQSIDVTPAEPVDESGRVTVTLPSLLAYDLIVLTYAAAN